MLIMNEKQQQAVLMMTEGKLYQEIAKELGVTSKTISQWRADPEFRATLNQHLENIKTAHSERLRNLQGIALETLEECLKDPKFSLLITHKSSKALLTELIPL